MDYDFGNVDTDHYGNYVNGRWVERANNEAWIVTGKLRHERFEK